MSRRTPPCLATPPRGARAILRGATLAAALLALVVGATSAGAETIHGFFEGPVHGHNAGSGAIGVTGWVVADSGVRRVVIQVDGIDLGEANFGAPRPQIADDFPGFPDSAGPGFTFNINSPLFKNGQHVVSAKVVTNAGTSRILPGSRSIFFTNNEAILAPFGNIEFPHPAATLSGTCGDDPPNDARRYSIVEGWALDLGMDELDAGVAWVELMVDGGVIADTVLGDIFDTGTAAHGVCTFDLQAGGLVNCYGLPRPDVERNYPFAFDAPIAGYRFAIDVGAMVDAGWARGHHVLTVRAGDFMGRTANIDEIPVNFFCAGDLGNEAAFGFIESPREGRTYGDTMLIRGWALDGEGIRAFGEVQILIDGEFVGLADYAVARRGQVLQRYPGYPDSRRPVFQAFFDTHALSDGAHDLQVFVVDNDGVRSLIGERRFFVDNVPGD